MASQTGFGHSLAEALLTKFPQEPSKTLARILYRDNIETFITFASAYNLIRYIRGTNGQRNRGHMIATGKTGHMEARSKALAVIAIPPEHPDLDWKPAVIHGSRYLCISDIHLPYHDKSSIQIAVADAKKFEVDAVFINGDLLDSYQLSRFAKSPTKPNYAEEVKMGKQFLGYLRQEFPDAHIDWKFGNHDMSLERFLWTKAPELFGCPGMDLEHFVDVSQYGVNVIKDNRRVMLGKLTALHGHEWNTGSIGPVNPARGAFLRLNESSIIGHYHRTSQHTETTLSEKLITCWSMGCLCRLHPEYARVNKWNLGYALIEVDKNGNFEVNNRRIFKGRSW